MINRMIPFLSLINISPYSFLPRPYFQIFSLIFTPRCGHTGNNLDDWFQVCLDLPSVHLLFALRHLVEKSPHKSAPAVCRCYITKADDMQPLEQSIEGRMGQCTLIHL